MAGSRLLCCEQRFDRGVRGESGASCAFTGDTRLRGRADSLALPRREHPHSRQCQSADIYAEILALLAALVSASFLFVLLRGACASRSPRCADVAGREVDRIRFLADGRTSVDLAGA